MEDKFSFLNGETKDSSHDSISNLDNVERKRIIFQTQNHIIDRIDQLEKEDKKRVYSHEDIRKEVNQLCTQLISSMNLRI